MTDPPPPSPTRRLAEHLVPGGLDAFVSIRRAAGTSWRVISRELYEATSGQVDVSNESLRQWYAHLDAEATP